MRRVVCLIVGAALFGAGWYLLLLHLASGTSLRIRIVLAAGLLLFGGTACLGTAVFDDRQR